MENKELFNKIDEFIKTNFGKKYRLKVFSMNENTFDDLSLIRLEKLKDDDTNLRISATFRELKEQVNKLGLEKTLNNIKEYLSDDIKIVNNDPLFLQALKLCIEEGSASVAFIQKQFNIGYARASRMIELMEWLGFISEKPPREILITQEEFAKRFGDIKASFSNPNGEQYF